MRSSFLPRFLVISGMIFAAAAIRLLPHPPNFAPIGAMALFGGACFTNRWAAFLIPMLAMFLSDCILGLHVFMPVVYSCFALYVLLGRWLCSKRQMLPIGGACVLGSVLFFTITNFGTWVHYGYVNQMLYTPDMAGLVECFVAAIPFYPNTLAGDLCFSILLFGSFAMAERFFPVLRENQTANSF